VCSSDASEKLIDSSYEVLSLNEVHSIDFYIDGADEYNDRKELIKGGGGALTREKIIASASKTFICIIDKSKIVDRFGKFPVAIEVIPMARSFVSRQVVAMGGRPAYRVGFITDNGNQIIDVSNLNFDVPFETESRINRIPGVVENGIFAARKADKIIVADGQKVSELK
jgi:ribose 5-phosphate isomerase A